jgi:hypothetical protein
LLAAQAAAQAQAVRGQKQQGAAIVLKRNVVLAAKVQTAACALLLPPLPWWLQGPSGVGGASSNSRHRHTHGTQRA